MSENTKLPTIVLQPITSSKIHSIGHDPVNNRMAVRFKNWKGEPTSLYQYENVSADQFAAFQGAKSPGQHFGQVFQKDAKAFPYIKVDETAQQDGDDQGEQA